MRVFANAKFPFLHWRRRAYILTAVVLAVGFGAMIRNVLDPDIRNWQNYGIDFTGGTVVQVRFENPTNVERVRQVTGNEWEIVQFGGGNEYLIRLGTFDQGAEADASRLVSAALATGYAADDFRIVRTEGVGPKVGAELQRNALIAIVLSLGATLLYLALRFEWRFGVAAVLATTHDILITLGFLALIQSEISLGSVAALLTVVGYSLNDTIVVFDRIRENLARPVRGESFTAMLDRSINETLPRTVLTGTTTLATLFSLLIFGGPVIRDFALVLILGIVIGTFSSIFVAAPVLYLIEQKWPGRQVKTTRDPGTSQRRQSATV